MARKVFPNPTAAASAVALVEECSYSEKEYSLNKQGRHNAACARWLASRDCRLALIKKTDVEDNMKDAGKVSAQFEADYLAWALPLHAGLCRIIEELD
jgi:hypothetical protein